MYLFKTSGKTFDSVVKYQKHAYTNKPRGGGLILVSKNKTDCRNFEKQIQYIMKLSSVRKIDNEKIREEVSRYWGKENKYRWKWLVDCEATRKLNIPFDLKDVIGKERVSDYGPVMTFKEVAPIDERIIIKFLEKNGDLN